MIGTNSSRLDIWFAAATLIVAGALAFAHQIQPRARPEDTISRLFGALASKDLGAMRTEMIPTAYDDFLRVFGAKKFDRVQRAYDRAYRLGDARWFELRQRSRGLAAQNYDQLRLRVTVLGREAFSALAVDARMKLMDDQDQYQKFLFDHGVSALPPTDRARLGNSNELRLGQDRDRFLDREGFAALPAEERAVIGSAAALADAQTEEKLALHDKFGLPLLSPDLREEIGNITRADLRDPQAFKLIFGAVLAKNFLQEHPFPAAAIPSESALGSCAYPWTTERGSLLRGDEAICKRVLPLPTGKQTVSIFLIKQGFEWRVSRISPALTEIGW